MLARTEPACLVIADIAGYSGYLAGVELDHAQDILADLVDVIVGALRPAFKLAKLEGDAAFVYVPATTVDGPGLRDVIERCYFAFQRRIRDIRQASTCECNACVRMPGLDLKFVAHHGLVARQRMAGREELVGSDVVVVHRLLKNRVAESLDMPAYVLYTDALVRAMGLADPPAAGMREYRESFESVGEVAGWVTDLGAAWEEERRRERTKISDDDALAVITIPAAVPRGILWEWATSPARRIRWTSGMTDVVEDLVNGRRGVGTVNHCVHGKNVIHRGGPRLVPARVRDEADQDPLQGRSADRDHDGADRARPGSDRPRLPGSPAALAQGPAHPAGDGGAVPDRRGARQRNAHRARRSRRRGACRGPCDGAGRPGEHHPPPVGAPDGHRGTHRLPVRDVGGEYVHLALRSERRADATSSAWARPAGAGHARGQDRREELCRGRRPHLGPRGRRVVLHG